MSKIYSTEETDPNIKSGAPSLPERGAFEFKGDSCGW